MHARQWQGSSISPVTEAVAARPRIARRLIVVLLLAALGLGAWLVLRPEPRRAPHLLVGVDDDTLKWTPNPLGVVRRQQALGAQAVRVGCVAGRETARRREAR